MTHALVMGAAKSTSIWLVH